MKLTFNKKSIKELSNYQSVPSKMTPQVAGGNAFGNYETLNEACNSQNACWTRRDGGMVCEIWLEP